MEVTAVKDPEWQEITPKYNHSFREEEILASRPCGEGAAFSLRGTVPSHPQAVSSDIQAPRASEKPVGLRFSGLREISIT